MDYIAPKTNYNLNQIGHFKQLVSGAGSKVFKVNDSGVFAGAASYGSAPFKLSYAGVLSTGLATGPSITMNGSAGTITLKYNNTSKGTISGYVTAKHSEDSYVRLSAISGRTLTLMESMIECDGNFMPADDIGSSLGSSSLRWNDVYAKSHIAWGTGAKFSINGSDGVGASTHIISSIGYDGSQLRYKYRNCTTIGGIVTELGSESGWNNVS